MTTTLHLRLDMVGELWTIYLSQVRDTVVVSSMGMPPMIVSEDMTENLMVGARPKHTPDSGHLPPDQREHVSVGEVPSTTG